jgi:hypothetical protein
MSVACKAGKSSYVRRLDRVGTGSAVGAPDATGWDEGTDGLLEEPRAAISERAWPRFIAKV